MSNCQTGLYHSKLDALNLIGYFLVLFGRYYHFGGLRIISKFGNTAYPSVFEKMLDL